MTSPYSSSSSATTTTTATTTAGTSSATAGGFRDVDLQASSGRCEITSNPFPSPSAVQAGAADQWPQQQQQVDSSGSSVGGSGSSVTSSSFVALSVAQLKQWTDTQYKVQRQRVSEKLLLPAAAAATGGATGALGVTPLDGQLEAAVARLRAQQRQHAQLVRLTRQVRCTLDTLGSQLAQLGDLAADMALKESAPAATTEEEEPLGVGQAEEDLRPQLGQLAAWGRQLGKETLAAKAAPALDFVAANLDTLVSKTMADSLDTVGRLGQVRLELDGQRNSSRPQGVPGLRAHFLRLQEDCKVKLAFVQHNRTKVMRKQLALLQAVLAALFPHSGSSSSSSSDAMDLTLRQFSVPLASAQTTPASSASSSSK
ncbi:Arfaptin-1 [Halotydeus destructor]|nr:Arfaptin-1 [Halotydeus destructor]